MSRYIDADALLAELQEEIDFKTSMYTEEQNMYFSAGLKCAYRDVKSQPTADVVEVVRCKDCKHNVANWEHDELDISDYTDITCDYFMTDGMEADDYCSYGERKEG